MYRLRPLIRGRIQCAFERKHISKRNNTRNILGCDYDKLKKHLEIQFTEGMTWDNQGGWHIDHIIPLSVADNWWELEILCYYSNLQPLWAFDNMSKGCKW